MIEEVCEEIIRKNKQNEIIKNLKKILPDYFEVTMFGDYRVRVNRCTDIFTEHYSVFKGHYYKKKEEKIYDIAYIWIDSGNIVVKDKELYPFLKEFGKKSNCKELIKCWEGAE